MMNLDVLTRPFEASQVKNRKGPKGKMLDYVETHTVIARLNDAFEGEWSFRVISHDVGDEEVLVLGELSAEGEAKVQFGSKVREDNVPLGDTAKAAASDALKKTATLFGVGLELYAKDSEDTSGQRRNEQHTQSGGDGRAREEHLTEAQRVLREHQRKAVA